MLDPSALLGLSNQIAAVSATIDLALAPLSAEQRRTLARVDRVERFRLELALGRLREAAEVLLVAADDNAVRAVA